MYVVIDVDKETWKIIDATLHTSSFNRWAFSLTDLVKDAVVVKNEDLEKMIRETLYEN